MKLSPHQQRVLAALLALQTRHAWNWWDRSDIGLVVGAGGFHGTIQIATMRALKANGLVCTERSSWPDSVRQVVRGCNCACYRWGLTEAGFQVAKSLAVRWSKQSESDVANAYTAADHEKLDEDDSQLAMQARFERSEDEEDGEGWKHGDA